MSTALAPATTVDASVVERVLIHGDLRQLTPPQKVSYYKHVCESVGLNPLTRPFEYIVLNGKETFYAKRDATDQLRKVHNVSVTIIAREVTEDCYVVTARATMPSGRQDESIGAVPIAALKGEARANAMMKCETKAKRRVTLSICGLGMLDETEVESIQAGAAPSYVVEAPADPPAAHEATAAPREHALSRSAETSAVSSETRSPDGDGRDKSDALNTVGGQPTMVGEQRAAGKVTTPLQSPMNSVPMAMGCAGSIPKATKQAGSEPAESHTLPEGATRITRVEGPNGKAKGFLYTSAYPYGNGPGLAVYDERLADLATQCCQDGTPVRLTLKKSAGSGKVYVVGIERVVQVERMPTTAGMIGEDEISF